LSSDLRFRFETDLSTGVTQIELFSLDNPYYTTYPINEMLYSLLNDIRQFQPKWAAYATPSNQACLHDLICKGILHLTSTIAKPDQTPSFSPSLRPRTTGVLEPQSKLPTQQAHDQPVQQADSPADLWKIRELETKTTPTCLSSYLG